MKNMISKIAGLAIIGSVFVTGVAFAAGGPTNKPKEQEWSL